MAISEQLFHIHISNELTFSRLRKFKQSLEVILLGLLTVLFSYL